MKKEVGMLQLWGPHRKKSGKAIQESQGDDEDDAMVNVSREANALSTKTYQLNTIAKGFQGY
jgi:hypothetical protein